MTTFYHVADESYRTGDNLYSYEELERRGYELPEYKWENLADTDVVCLFNTAEEAIEFRNDWLQSGTILKVTIPTWAKQEGLRMTKVSEGFDAVVNHIPFEFIG